MVEFSQNITTEFWDETLFNCEISRTGRQELREIARHWLVDGFDQRRNQEETIEYWSIDKAIERFDLELLGTGKTRVVVYPPDRWLSQGNPQECVVKIQWDEYRHQNFNELQVWKEANGRQAAILNPVLDEEEIRANWLLVPKADNYRNIKTSTVHQIANKLRGKATELGMKARDVRAGNVGRVEGRDVIIDYGQLQIN